jgi:hypothetical protein
MSRQRLIQRIEGCLALGTSDNDMEASLAFTRAEELRCQYEVRVSDLSPRARAIHDDLAAAATLNQSAVLTIRASRLGGRRDHWMVTGHGEVDTPTMLAIAALSGWNSQWSPV